MLAEWIVKNCDQLPDGESLNFRSRDAVARVGLDTVLEKVTRPSQLEKLSLSLHSEEIQRKIATRIIELNCVREYIKNYEMYSTKLCRTLFEAIRDQKEILELSRYVGRGGTFIAYEMAPDEVINSPEHSENLLNLITEGKSRVSPEIESLVRKMGRKIVYDIVAK